MKTRTSKKCVLALVAVSSISLLSASAFAQAGLSGNALEGQMEEMRGKAGNFGSNSQSALGQLEDISGGTVDRSSSSRTTAPRSYQQSSSTQSRYNANRVYQQQMAGAVAGALVGALFSSLLNDNSAAQRQAQAEAEARARAEAEARAEALRIQQELARQARIRQAQRYRAEWDAREGEITDRLGGAFDFHPNATAFFGSNPNPDPRVLAALDIQPLDYTNTHTESSTITNSDPTVVDLSDSSLVVNPLRNGVTTNRMPTRSSGSLMPRWAWDWASPPPPRKPPSELQQLLAYFGPWLGKWYKETVAEGAIKSTLWGFAKRKSQYFGENMLADYGQGLYSFEEQRKDLTKTLGDRAENMIEGILMGQATSVARTVSDPNSQSSAYLDESDQFLDYTARKLKADTYETAAEQMFAKSEMPDLYDLKSPSVDYNITPVRNVAHPDEARVNQILLGSSRATSPLTTHRNINGLPGSFGAPAPLD